MTYFFQMRGKRHEAESLAEISAIYSGLRDASKEGNSTFPSVTLRSTGPKKLVGHISYNGRIWAHGRKEFPADAKPLYDNR